VWEDSAFATVRVLRDRPEALAQDVLGVQQLQLYALTHIIHERFYRKPENAFFVKRPSTGSGRPEPSKGVSRVSTERSMRNPRCSIEHSTLIIEHYSY
jgi:hypothetical protein